MTLSILSVYYHTIPLGRNVRTCRCCPSSTFDNNTTSDCPQMPCEGQIIKLMLAIFPASVKLSMVINTTTRNLLVLRGNKGILSLYNNMCSYFLLSPKRESLEANSLSRGAGIGIFGAPKRAVLSHQSSKGTPT